MKQLITIVAGSRSISDKEIVENAINVAPFEISELVSGNANGVDKLGEEWANENGVDVERFPVTQSDYNEKGKKAPLDRNEDMVEYADALIAVWDGNSNGTKHIIEYANREGIVVYVHHTETLSLDQFVTK